MAKRAKSGGLVGAFMRPRTIRAHPPCLREMTATVALGVVAAAGAAACFDGAVLLQAADAREVDRQHGLRLSLLRRLVVRRRWLAGTALAVFGVPLHLAAFALAPVAVVQPTLAL